MRKFWRRIKFLANIRKSVPFIIKFFRSSDVKLKHKLLSILLIIGYFLFPWDIVPDFLILLGFVDDVAILAFVLQQMVKMAPESLKKEFHPEEKL
ncbi:YkvA family protein [Halobacillus sp. Marseille-Q1614]|uniref:YkvA family protein n=1 Tax=Halobacillus sp. Marseille-Q1614 TaxID=2709134 RepID=UPI0015705DE5|nr:DUF1232 domain-containing protein [Halobacillus sp. Marseille-Q1614]